MLSFGTKLVGTVASFQELIAFPLQCSQSGNMGCPCLQLYWKVLACLQLIKLGTDGKPIVSATERAREIVHVSALYMTLACAI